jgi:hypothetical protein
MHWHGGREGLLARVAHTVGDVTEWKGSRAGPSTTTGHSDLSLEAVVGALVVPQLIWKTRSLHNQHILMRLLLVHVARKFQLVPLR